MYWGGGGGGGGRGGGGRGSTRPTFSTGLRSPKGSMACLTRSPSPWATTSTFTFSSIPLWVSTDAVQRIFIFIFTFVSVLRILSTIKKFKKL